MNNRILLSWDKEPARLAWSAQLIESVTSKIDDLESGAPEAFIRGYATLDRDNRIKFWCELLIAVAWFESNWRADTVYHEPAPLNVDSIGLLQLSYSDAADYPLEPIGGAKNSLEDPLVNLRCGTIIFATLLARDRTIVAFQEGKYKGAGRYWSVIRPGPNHHQDEIKARVRKAFGW